MTKSVAFSHSGTATMRPTLPPICVAALCILLCLLRVAPTRAAPPRPQLAATFSPRPPVLDGKLDDAAWQLTALADAFVQKFPNEGKDPSAQTTVRALYDNSTLYIGIRCHQRDFPIVARLVRRDQQIESDWVQINIDSMNRGSKAFQFAINAAGVLSDGIRFNDTEYSAEWDALWDARVARFDGGWTAEFAIPFEVLEFDSLPAQEWGLQVRRYISARQELNEWARISRAMAGEVSKYGKLINLKGLHHKQVIEIQPFMIGNLNWFDMSAYGKPLHPSTFGLSAGLDLKWHITRGLTLSLAVNPDVAQMEADQLIVNLTTFENLFPEKRPFFLQGFDIFQTPMQVFYSRRIGMNAVAPALDPDPLRGERLINAPGPSTLYGAVKLTGTLGRRLTAGLLSTVTARNDAQVWTPTAGTVSRLAEPLTVYNVLRLRWAIEDNTTVGLLASSVNRFEPMPEEYSPLRPANRGSVLCPSGVLAAPGSRCFNDSYVVSADGLWRSRDGDYVASGQVVVTSSSNGPPRTLRDGTIIQSGALAPGGRVYLAKEGGKWLGSLELEGMSRTMDYNDIGFMRRQNQLKLFASLDYHTIVPLWQGRILESRTHIQYSLRNNLDGLNLWRGYYLGTELRFRNGWNAGIELYFYDRRFDDREVGDGTALQRERLVGWDVTINTDPRRKIAATLFAETLALFNGFSININASLTAQVLPQLQISILPQAYYSFGEPRFISMGNQPAEYLMGRLRAQSLGAVLRANYAFTPRLTLQFYSQLFLLTKHYYDFSSYISTTRAAHAAIKLEDLAAIARPQLNPDSSETALNINVVLRWELALGSTLYLLYARAHTPSATLLDGESAQLDLGALRSGPAIDSLLLKFSYRLH